MNREAERDTDNVQHRRGLTVVIFSVHRAEERRGGGRSKQGIERESGTERESAKAHMSA